MTGEGLLRVLATLANPHRLKVVAALTQERNYVSQLARELDISRALLQVHLRKLEAAGLVSAAIEVSEDGKAMKFYEVTHFTVLLTPEAIASAVRTLGIDSDVDVEVRPWSPGRLWSCSSRRQLSFPPGTSSLPEYDRRSRR
jgi:predicted transcriptional regulator